MHYNSRIQWFNSKSITARLKQVDLVTKTDFDTKLKYLSKKINSNKKNHLSLQNELNRLKKKFLKIINSKCSFWRRWCPKLPSISAN